MEYINPNTRKSVYIVSLDAKRETVTVTTKKDKFDVSTLEVLSNTGIDFKAIKAAAFKELQSKGFYEDYIDVEDYIDWPRESELPEYNANYRVYIPDIVIRRVNIDPTMAPLMAGIKDDHKKEISGGVQVYLNFFDEGHAFIATYVLGLTIEKNPHKTVPELDMTPPEGFIAPETI